LELYIDFAHHYIFLAP